MASLVSNDRRLFWLRVALAGPWTLVASVVTMAGMATWLPPGVAGVDNLILPLVMYPLVWAAFFFSACLDSNLRRAATVSFAITGLHVALLVRHFLA